MCVLTPVAGHPRMQAHASTSLGCMSVGCKKWALLDRLVTLPLLHAPCRHGLVGCMPVRCKKSPLSERGVTLALLHAPCRRSLVGCMPVRCKKSPLSTAVTITCVRPFLLLLFSLWICAIGCRHAAGRRGGAIGAGGARRGSGRVCVGARGARSALSFNGKGFHADAAHVSWHSIFVVISVSVSISPFNCRCTLIRNVRISIRSSSFEPSTDSVPTRNAFILVDASSLTVGSCNTALADCDSRGNLAIAGLAEAVFAPRGGLGVGSACLACRLSQNVLERARLAHGTCTLGRCCRDMAVFSRSALFTRGSSENVIVRPWRTRNAT